MFKKEIFSNILSKIKETYKSIADFADNASLDRSYLSKYINLKLDNPPSPEILKKIASASHGITSYYELMEICDYVDLSSVFSSQINSSTNIIYLNKQDLKTIGFDDEDIRILSNLSSMNKEDAKQQLSNILNKYSNNDETLLEFYKLIIYHFDINISNNYKCKDIEQQIIDYLTKNKVFIDNNELQFYKDNLDNDVVPIPLIRNCQGWI